MRGWKRVTDSLLTKWESYHLQWKLSENKKGNTVIETLVLGIVASHNFVSNNCNFKIQNVTSYLTIADLFLVLVTISRNVTISPNSNDIFKSPNIISHNVTQNYISQLCFG